MKKEKVYLISIQQKHKTWKDWERLYFTKNAAGKYVWDVLYMPFMYGTYYKTKKEAIKAYVRHRHELPVFPKAYEYKPVSIIKCVLTEKDVFLKKG